MCLYHNGKCGEFQDENAPTARVGAFRCKYVVKQYFFHNKFNLVQSLTTDESGVKDYQDKTAILDEILWLLIVQMLQSELTNYSSSHNTIIPITIELVSTSNIKTPDALNIVHF